VKLPFLTTHNTSVTKPRNCLNSACLITPSNFKNTFNLYLQPSTFKNTFNLCPLWQPQPIECDVADAATRRVQASKPQRSNAALQASFTDGDPT
jgi:hypothetical protein